MTDQLALATDRRFSDLLPDKDLIEALGKLNITVPTEVQAEAIPAALSGNDLIVQAQTGSGKTLAFSLPMILKLRQRPAKATGALVVTPTRELAVQVTDVVSSIAPEFAPVCIIGGEHAHKQTQRLKNDARVVVGTPGRLLDLLSRGSLDLSKCGMFVLDEADEMLSMGFIDEVREILRALPRERQGMFFSATITGRVHSFAQSFLRDPKTISVRAHEASSATIEHCYLRVSSGVTEKANALSSLLRQLDPKSAIVFCNTKSDTELVEVFLKRRGYDARRLNSDLSQKEREAVVRDLRDGKLRYLIGTDVAARGIDIKELELVVNYSLPEDQEVYVHRTGRTGRAGANGTAVSLIGPQDFGAFLSLKHRLSDELTEITLLG